MIGEQTLLTLGVWLRLLLLGELVEIVAHRLNRSVAREWVIEE